jgi:hypothetical protein
MVGPGKIRLRNINRKGENEHGKDYETSTKTRKADG